MPINDTKYLIEPTFSFGYFTNILTQIREYYMALGMHCILKAI